MMTLVFLLLILATVSECLLSITSSTPSGTIMSSGEEFTLSCTTNLPWFLCIWEGPMGLACQCKTEEGGVRQMCLGDSRITLSGRNVSCSMTISGVTEEDRGQYRCVLADREDITTVTRSIEDVGVAVRAVVSWGADTSGTLTSGTEAEFSCLAEGGYPEPEIEVLGPTNMSMRRQDSSRSSNPHGFDVVQTMTYQVREEDNGNLVTCTSRQLDRRGQVLYTSSANMKLRIVPEIAASRIDCIIGILLGALLLLCLCCSFIIFFLCCPMGRKCWIKKGCKEDQISLTDDPQCEQTANCSQTYCSCCGSGDPPDVPEAESGKLINTKVQTENLDLSSRETQTDENTENTNSNGLTYYIPEHFSFTKSLHEQIKTYDHGENKNEEHQMRKETLRKENKTEEMKKEKNPTKKETSTIVIHCPIKQEQTEESCEEMFCNNIDADVIRVL